MHDVTHIMPPPPQPTIQKELIKSFLRRILDEAKIPDYLNVKVNKLKLEEELKIKDKLGIMIENNFPIHKYFIPFLYLTMRDKSLVFEISQPQQLQSLSAAV